MINWNELRQAARDAMTMAYAPYSGYPVGAAGLSEDGRIFSGCNVENAGYGVALCAECGMISELVRNGGGRLVAFTCVNGNGEITVPCGRCRQLLWEHGGPTMEIEVPAGIMRMSDVLPFGFGPEDLDKVERNSNG